MRAFIINDIHMADNPPSSCTDSYKQDLLDLLGHVSDLPASDDVIVLAGDVFHAKTARRTSHATVRSLIEWAHDAPCPVLAVAGNHDLYGNRLDSLPKQPLGVVVASGAVTLLDGWHQELPLYGVSWVRPWCDAVVEQELDDWREVDRGDALVVTHAPLYPPGQELRWENYPTRSWAAAMDSRGTCSYGHVHEHHGVYEVDGVRFSNPGALSRGSLHEHNLSRQVSIAVWDSGTGQTEIVPLPAKPAHEVLKVAEALERKADEEIAQQFLESVSQASITVTTVESVIRQVQEMDLPEPVRLKATALLEESC